MTNAAQPGRKQAEQDRHAESYETLRAYSVGRRVAASRDGLVVLLRQGVAAWMSAWSRLPTRPTPPLHIERQPPSPLPLHVNAEVIHILATMTLKHLQETST